MAKQKARRETATKNVRIYPSTSLTLQNLSLSSGKTIARLIFEAFYKRTK